jgi:hypothetical protein
MFSWIIPSIAWASTGTLSVKTIVYRIDYYVLNPLIQLGFVVALIIFVWGVIEYIRDKNQGSVSVFNKNRGGGAADHILWGLVGLLIMVSAFGIMTLIKNVIGSTIPTPT